MMVVGAPLDSDRAGSRPQVPEFPDTLEWLNQRERIRLADLRGRVVLVVFWNGCSTSSANLLASVRQLEKRHPGGFVLLGVHTPRYASQQSEAAVAAAARRYGVRAAVANDNEWLAWKLFAITAWPTTLVIDPDGGLAACLVGGACIQEIEDTVTQLRDSSAGPQHPAAVPQALQDVRSGAIGPLAFPAHALATPTHLFVSDAGHHRVLQCRHDGRVLRQFGSGTPGDWDGHLAACGFQSPQGLALDGNTVYVADAGNHKVRSIRLDTGDVQTVLGAGRPAWKSVEEQGSGLGAAINAPHAVAVDGHVLYVAATGQHQILRADLRDQRIGTIAGDGCDDVRDGIGGQSSLSQPAAIALMAGQLLVADAGGNAIRRLRFADLALTTLAGSSPWEPGYRDGAGRQARFAWPSGLAVVGSRVFVADLCNGRLCSLDPYSGEVATLQLEQPLGEPQGLSHAGGALWVADRGAHAIFRIDPEKGTCERVPVDE